MQDPRFILRRLGRRLIAPISRALTPRPPAVARYRLGSVDLQLPGDHALPLIRQAMPFYSDNVARIAEALYWKYPEMSILDVGANVGDTAACLRAKVPCPILCVEGCEAFLRFLYRNASSIPGVEIEPAFVGDAGRRLNGTPVVREGTARIVPAAGNGAMTSARPLEEIIESHPRFSDAKLLKIDTDGFDVPILLANLPLLASRRPAVFFEYDPNLFALPEDQGFAVFERLRGVGYAGALFYENNGEYLLSTHLEDTQTLRDLHEFVVGRRSMRYWDIAVFHADDADVCESLRQSEVEFFRNARAGGKADANAAGAGPRP